MSRVMDEDEKALLTPVELEMMEEDDASDLDRVLPAEADELDPLDLTPEDKPETPAAAQAAPLVAPAAYVPTFTTADEAELARLAGERAAFVEQADDGEITFKELAEKQAEIDTAAAALNLKKMTDAATIAAHQQTADAIDDAAWEKDVNTFFTGQQLADRTKIPAEVASAFNIIVLKVTGTEIGDGLDAAGQLAMSLEIFNRKFPGKWPGSAAKAKPNPADPKPNEALIPPNIGLLPSVDLATVDDGQFAALDRLLESGESDRHERELARLSPERREAYLAAS